MSKSTVNQLLQTAGEQGILSPGSMQVLNVRDIGRQIQAGLGMNAADLQASESVLVTQLVDDSGSIRFASNAQAVRDGHNLVIDSLNESKQKSGILMHTRYLNGNVLFPYSLLENSVRMDQHNYDPMGGTPLYDQTVVILGTVLTKAQELAEQGIPTRTVTLIITDGHDEGSMKQTPQRVSKVVKDMLLAETHIIAAMGIDDGGVTDFRAVFQSMGLEDKWILTPANTQKEIRAAFKLFSQSAVRASQSAKSFSQTAMGGFGK